MCKGLSVQLPKILQWHWKGRWEEDVLCPQQILQSPFAVLSAIPGLPWQVPFAPKYLIRCALELAAPTRADHQGYRWPSIPVCMPINRSGSQQWQECCCLCISLWAGTMILTILVTTKMATPLSEDSELSDAHLESLKEMRGGRGVPLRPED